MANGANQIIERVVNAAVFNEAGKFLGIASIDLPQIQAMADTVSGAGIAGEVESPVLGHFQAMTTTFHWRSIEPDAVALCEQRAHQVDCRASQQVTETATGESTTMPVRTTMKIIPKSFNMGSLQPGTATDSEQEFEVIYIKLFVDGAEVLEIDKYNFVCRINGNDLLASVRSDLGLN